MTKRQAFRKLEQMLEEANLPFSIEDSIRTEWRYSSGEWWKDETSWVMIRAQLAARSQEREGF